MIIKPAKPNLRIAGFTLIELFVIIATILVLVLVIIPQARKAKARAQRIHCVSNLKHIGLSFKMWALDHTNSYPMSVSTNHGGTKELISNGGSFRHFEVMSNELNTPVILVCPSDRQRTTLRNFDPGFSNSNVSYFVGLKARDDWPQMLLTGDRNIFNGVRPAAGVVGLTTNNTMGWGPGLHNGAGNVALADGSVQQLTSSRLREALGNAGVQTNWLQLP